MKDDINYAEKIATFNLLVGNNNEDIAFNYLSMANWDETQAAILYNKENKGANATLINTNDNNINSINQNLYPNKDQDIIPIEKDSIYNQPNNNQKINPYNQNNYNNYMPNQPSVLNKYNQCEIFINGPLDGLKFWKVDNRGYFINFQQFNNCIKLYNVFITNLSTNVGIIYIYDKRTINDAVTILQNLNNNEQTRDLLNQRCVIHPMINKCIEASSIIKSLKIKTFPTMVICFHKNESYFSVISQINNIMNNIPLLTQKLIEAHELFGQTKKVYRHPYPNSYNNYINDLKNKNNNSINPQTNNNQINQNPNNKSNNIINNININNNIINNNNNIINNPSNNSSNLLADPRNYMMDDDVMKNDMYPYMSDGEVLKKQEEEMKNLERKEEEKVRKKKQEEEMKKLEEEKRKREEIEEKNKIENILKQLPQEPSDDTPNKCTIMFRFPDGEKTVQRKFLKSDKVSLLYTYIKSLGREIYTENNENSFSLVQPFPFKNYNELQDNTLEQEGLFPNAVLQIRTM